MSIRTSHVGSFPLTYTVENVIRVVKDMKSVNLDVPPYPQLRSFIEIYLEPLVTQGVLRKEKGFFIIKEVAESKSFSIKSIRIPEAETTVSVVKKENLGFKWLRAPVTGVFTLASRVNLLEASTKGISGTALSDKSIVGELIAEFVKEVVRYMFNIGYNVVFLDEPSLTLIVGKKRLLFNYSEDDVIETLDSVARSISGEVGVHICGNLHYRLLELIARIPSIKYISIELHDIPQNVNFIDKHVLEMYDKFISPGIVSAKKPIIEDLDSALNILKTVYEKSGGRVDLVSGDCGFGGLKGLIGDEEREYAISLGKLDVIVKAVKFFEKNTLRIG